MSSKISEKSDKITVIVPCYNVENYLERCLDSLLHQTYKNTEIIMVEDCSTDGTKKIIRRYEQKYNNFKAIYNKKNGGLGNARNVGIDATCTEYITFLDSDDWLPENYLEEMVTTITDKNSDLSVCDFYLRYDDAKNDQRIIAYNKKPNKVGLIDTGMAASSSNKLFKTELFKDLRYPVGIVNEDIPVILTILHNSKVAYTPNTFFNYYQRPGSIQNGKITHKRLDVFKSVNLLKKNLNNKVDYKIWQAIVWHQIIAIFIYVLPKSNSIIERRELIKGFYELTKKHDIGIEDNFGYKQFLKNSGIDKLYGTLSIKALNSRHFLLCSFYMGIYRFYTSASLSSRIVRKMIFAVKRPKEFTRQVFRFVAYHSEHRNVIRTKADFGQLIVAAKKQSKLPNKNSISVIIPNYNYEKFLVERVYSILHQTSKVGEIIILDDNSKDNSVILAEKIKNAVDKYVSVQLVNNSSNQGTFRQWEKGFEKANFNYVWIAEADDYSNERFLENALKPFAKDSNIVISYVNTGYIDEKGLLLGTVRNDIDYQKSGHWDKSYINSGYDEAKTYTYLNNTIANVSSVVFQKKSDIDYKKLFADALKYRQVGDWIFYINYMLNGNIAYTNKTLNYYRLHGNNVSSTMKARDHINEILELQEIFIKKLNLSKSDQRNMNRRIMFLKKAWKII